MMSSRTLRTGLVLAVLGVASLGTLALFPWDESAGSLADEPKADPSPAPLPRAESGRLVFQVEADGVKVDESGKPLPGGGVSYTQTCEADALAVIEGNQVVEVREVGTAHIVEQGERVESTIHEGVIQVYRDREGKLHTGCDPESWVIIDSE
jgi:hypothetical protein